MFLSLSLSLSLSQLRNCFVLLCVASLQLDLLFLWCFIEVKSAREAATNIMWFFVGSFVNIYSLSPSHETGSGRLQWTTPTDRTTDNRRKQSSLSLSNRTSLDSSRKHHFILLNILFLFPLSLFIFIYIFRSPTLF